MRWTARAVVVALGAGAAAVALAGQATATPTATKDVAAAASAAHALSAKRAAPPAPTPDALPPRWTIVATDNMTAPAGGQWHGSVACPARTVPYGGGVNIASLSVLANVNSSYPTTDGWAADVNNASASATGFAVYALCAKKTTTWTIVQGTATTNPAGQQTTATVQCPAGTKVLGGGGFSNTASTAVNQNTTIPSKMGKGTSAVYGWRVDQNNASGTGTTVTAYAVCGRAAGYTQVIGAPVTNAPGAQTSAHAACPAPKIELGGGMFSSSGSTAVNINTTDPNTPGWDAYQNNNSTSSATLTPYVVCAGT